MWYGFFCPFSGQVIYHQDQYISRYFSFYIIAWLIKLFCLADGCHKQLLFWQRQDFYFDSDMTSILTALKTAAWFTPLISNYTAQ